MQCYSYDNQGLVYVFEITSILVNLLALLILFILYLLGKIKWQLFSVVLDHLQLVAISPLLYIAKKKIYQLYFEVMQYSIGPPDLFALANKNADYISK